jgi:hypothetical protein
METNFDGAAAAAGAVAVGRERGWVAEFKVGSSRCGMWGGTVPLMVSNDGVAEQVASQNATPEEVSCTSKRARNSRTALVPEEAGTYSASVR